MPAETKKAAVPVAEDPRALVPVPGPGALEKLRKEKFGDGPGSIQVDVQDAGRKVELVFSDEFGQETGREPYEPEVKALPPEGATTPALRAAAGLEPADPGPDRKSAPLRAEVPAPVQTVTAPVTTPHAKK